MQEEFIWPDITIPSYDIITQFLHLNHKINKFDSINLTLVYQVSNFYQFKLDGSLSIY